MSPAANLAALLRALAARAAEHSSPIALSQILAEGFGAIAGTLEEAERVVGDAMAHALAALPLTAEDREALRAAGVPLADAPADQAQQPAEAPAVVADQVETAVVPQIGSIRNAITLAVAQVPVRLSPEAFDAAVADARSLLFGQVAE